MKTKNKLHAGLVIGGLLIVGLALLLNPMSWEFKKLDGQDYFRLLGAMFFVALIMERALEVYVGALHAPETEELQYNLDRQQDKLDFKEKERKLARETAEEKIKWLKDSLRGLTEGTGPLDGKTDEWSFNQIESLRKERDDRIRKIDLDAEVPLIEHDRIRQALMKHKVHTKLSVFKWSTIWGLIISALGLRTLGQLIDPACLADMQIWQERLLMAVDVIISGGLLAGGSEGIHKIMQAVTTFLDAAAAGNKEKIRG